MPKVAQMLGKPELEEDDDECPPTRALVSKDALANDAQAWSAKALAVRITDAASCVQASHLLQSLRGIRLEINVWFKPHVDRAMDAKRHAEAARKGLVDEQTKLEAPLVDAENRVKRALLAYADVQEAERRAEEARLQAEAQRQAESTVLETAALLEREGFATGDFGMLEEAESLMTQPVEAMAVSVASSVPKVRGVVYRDHWVAHPTVDIKALAAAVGAGLAPVTLLLPNMPALNAMARATQGTQDVPGVRFLNDKQVATTGRV